MRGSSTAAVDGSDLVMTRAEFARHRGVKQPYVNKLIDQGVLSGAALLRDGRILVKVAEAQIDRHSDPARGRHGRHILSAEAATDPAYAVERTRHERAKARLAELELDRQMGKLLAADDVRQAAGELAEQMRQGMEAMVPRFVRACRSAKSEAAAERALHALLLDFRRELAASLERRFQEIAADA